MACLLIVVGPEYPCQRDQEVHQLIADYVANQIADIDSAEPQVLRALAKPILVDANDRLDLLKLLEVDMTPSAWVT